MQNNANNSVHTQYVCYTVFVVKQSSNNAATQKATIMRNLITFDDAIENAFTIDITVNEMCAGVQVNGIGMFFDEEHEGYELTVNWTETGDAEFDEAAMWAFYRDGAFDERLTQILLDNGFSADAAEDVCGSEAGMQEEGRASYDAGTLAEEVAAYMATEFNAS